MSKGLGRVQREVEAILIADPDNAFTIEELCQRIYQTDNVEKRHRVAVIRGAKGLCKVRPEIGLIHTWSVGSRLALYHRRSVSSYAIGHLKGEGLDEDRVQYRLSPEGYLHHLVIEGGDWWLDVQEWIAEHDGNAELQAKIKPFLEKRKMILRAALAMVRMS